MSKLVKDAEGVNKKIEKEISSTLEDTVEKFAWFDYRAINDIQIGKTILNTLCHLQFEGMVVNEEQLDQIPKGMKKIKILEKKPNEQEIEKLCSKYDVLILKNEWILSDWFKKIKVKFTKPIGTQVNVISPETLQLAVEMTHHVEILLVEFKDETKIPLEIVLADAQNFGTSVVMKVKDAAEAKVVFGVLEFGADGVLFETTDINLIHHMHEKVNETKIQYKENLVEMKIISTKHIGMGERACVDLTSYLGLDEGILLGSFSNGGILACSETHPLPYMPTRPFRVNAGAIQSYVLAPDNQTWYLSDLRSGMEVLVVNTSGNARRVPVGRIKIERRPLLYIEAEAPDGTRVNVIMQEDWHVRIFGIDGKPRNITTLKPGDKVLGYTMKSGRHVGVQVGEMIVEQ